MPLGSDDLPSTGEYRSTFDAAAYLDLLDAEGGVLLKTAQERGPAAEIPFCPGWTVGDLVPHLGFVYRWAGTVVADRLAEPPPREAFFDPDPGDFAAAYERTREAFEANVRTLRASPPDLACWTIWPGPGRDFWVRRMLHETLVHRVDAENAGGTPATGARLDPAIAADGVDEMVCGFASRYSKRLRADAPVTLAIHATDVDLRWWVRIGPDAPLFGRGLSPFGADTDVAALAGELYLLLWNRRTADGLTVLGNPEALELWGREAHL
jgi:uncharacterized protein (TIGR03083 family)